MFIFAPNKRQVFEMADQIIYANISPLFSGDDEYLVIAIPFIYKNLLAKGHQPKYNSIYFLVLICRDPKTNEWVPEEYTIDLVDCRDYEVDIKPLEEGTRSVFFGEDR